MVIFILTVWQWMHQVSRTLTTFVNIIMTMPHIVLYIHVLIEFIFNTIINNYMTWKMVRYKQLLQLAMQLMYCPVRQSAIAQLQLSLSQSVCKSSSIKNNSVAHTHLHLSSTYEEYHLQDSYHVNHFKQKPMY